MTTHHLKFRAENKDVFEAVRDGRKKIETRAATEKFRDIKRGDAVRLVCGDDAFTKTVKNTELFSSINALLEKYKPQDINPACASVKDIRAMYHSFPNYKEKIEEYGLIALELE
ncbi:MAG: ASCH domain-containing protein [Patescibacteria group bacterium]